MFVVFASLLAKSVRGTLLPPITPLLPLVALMGESAGVGSVGLFGGRGLLATTFQGYVDHLLPMTALCCINCSSATIAIFSCVGRKGRLFARIFIGKYLI